MRTTVKSIIEASWFTNGITALIIINFFTILAATEGYDLEVVELGILAIFTVEVIMKLYVYRPRLWIKDGWNVFDGLIVILGILPLLSVPLPEGFASARALRLLRLLGRIPATKVLIEAIGKSLGRLAGAGLLSGLCMVIFTLMATQAFQHSLPHWFGDFGTSLKTLLGIAAFSNLEAIGEAFNQGALIAVVVFTGYIISVPLTALNLVIGILSQAIDQVEASDDDEGDKETLWLHEEVRSLRQEVAELKSLLQDRR